MNQRHLITGSVCAGRLSAIGTTAGLLVCLALVAGCESLRTAGSMTSGREARDLQRSIDRKIDDQREPAEGSERWAEFKSSAYQKDSDILKSEERLRYERERTEVAGKLLKAGPLSLEQCIVFSLEFNDAIQAQRDQLRSVSGDELINISRFLPYVTYNQQSQRIEPDLNSPTTVTGETNTTYRSWRVSQTLLELGKDNLSNVALRDTQRSALFAYEDSVRSVLTGVRKRFFTVVLRAQQRAQQEEMLVEFRERYNQMRELAKARRVLEVDVLTARLNVLTGEGRINSLEKEILRQKFDLLHLMGLPVGMTQIQFAGSVEDIGLSPDEAVTLALRRSSAIAQNRATVAEQSRIVKETRWDYFPNVGLEAGWQKYKSFGGLELAGTNGYYTASAFGEAYAEAYPGRFGDVSSLLQEGEEGWFMNLSIQLPVFQGLAIRGEYIKQKRLLDRYQHELRAVIEGVEAEVRKAYQTVLEQRQGVELLKETVAISRERLRVQDRLKELGKISDNELETFRTRYFADLDAFYSQQIQLVEAQENLRYSIRYFEPTGAAPKPAP
jgi:outer membrane protein TolC